MIIATFNVNSVRSRLHILERWLNETRPDILFMQETKTQDEFFPEIAFQELGYRSYFHGEKSYNGVAAIVKNEIDDVDVTFGFENNSGEIATRTKNFTEQPTAESAKNSTHAANFASRVLTLRHKDFTILNTYVPQGKSIEHPDFEVKKKFLARVREIIEREVFAGSETFSQANAENTKKFLWLGDLNVAPTPLDVTHPENKKNHPCFCSEIRETFDATKKGLVDILRLFDSSCVFTFFDYRLKDAVNKNIGWRIDHMLASPSLAELAIRCWVDLEPRKWERPSDHTPLVAEFKLE